MQDLWRGKAHQCDSISLFCIEVNGASKGPMPFDLGGRCPVEESSELAELRQRELGTGNHDNLDRLELPGQVRAAKLQEIVPQMPPPGIPAGLAGVHEEVDGGPACRKVDSDLSNERRSFMWIRVAHATSG